MSILLLMTLAFAVPPLGDPCVPEADAAHTWDGVAFPFGEASFADVVVGYQPGPGVSGQYGDPATALGPPDWQDGVGAVSLGRMGKKPASLVVAFQDVLLADIQGFDLWIFEVGP